MKKILNISVIAALTILPVTANAAVTDAVPGPTVTGDDATAATATTDPKYGLAQPNANVDGVVATAGYVKGAYNAAIKAINKVSETANSAVKGIQVNGADLSLTGGKANVTITEGSANGTVKVNGTDVNVHGLGTAAYTDSTAYISSSAGSVKTANIDDGQVTKEKLATAVQTSLDGAVQGVTLNGNALTETDGVVNVTAVQSVTTGTANGTVKVDNTDVAVAGWATKQDALDTTQMAAVNSGIDSTKVGQYDALVTASSTYATQTGVEKTAAAAVNGATVTYSLAGLGTTTATVTGTVPVVDTWGATAPAANGVSVDLANNTVVTGLTGNTANNTATISAGTVTYTEQ